MSDEESPDLDDLNESCKCKKKPCKCKKKCKCKCGKDPCKCVAPCEWGRPCHLDLEVLPRRYGVFNPDGYNFQNALYVNGPYINGPYAAGNGPFAFCGGPKELGYGPYINGPYAYGNGPAGKCVAPY